MADIDQLLWKNIKSGDKVSFEIFFQKYYQILCLFSKRFTNDIELSREVIQDLLVTIWENRNKITIHTTLKSYLYTAVRYNSIRKLEKEKKYSIKLDSLPETEDSEYTDQLEFAELQQRIMDAIDSLPNQCRKIFKMSRFEHLKYSEIAENLELSIKTIENQISKALKVIHHNIDNFISILLLCNILLFFDFLTKSPFLN